MTQPKLALRNSGFGGRGYRDFRTGEVVPSITTVLGAINKDGITQWAVDQTAAYAVANVDWLLSRSEEVGWNGLRWYWRRGKETDWDDPEIDIHNYHEGVLNDLAELGDLVHEYVEADLNGWFEPELVRDEQYSMIEAYLLWKDEHDIEVIATEVTVFGNGYAGTFDAILKIDGVVTLVDVKTSRAVRDTHIGQIAALAYADVAAVQVPAGTLGAYEFKPRKNDKTVDSYWMLQGMWDVDSYAVLQIRPDDVDSAGNVVPAFCELHELSREQVDAGWGLFQGALQIRQAEKKLKEATKAVTHN